MQIEPDKLFFNEKITSMDKSSMQGPNKGKKKLAYLKKNLLFKICFWSLVFLSFLTTIIIKYSI